ncbi:MAG: flagellar export chaperone FliS [Planctomycetota bacterium]|jgi:flagellar protein FliS
MSPTPSRTSAANTKAYLRTKIMTAGPAELRLMLFDGALKFAEKGRAGLVESDFEAAYEGISRCQQILLELINGLRPDQDPALCERLSGLYTFLYTRLIDASRERSAEIVEEVIKLLEYERQTWSMLLEKLAEATTGGEQGLPDGPDQTGGSVSVEG